MSNITNAPFNPEDYADPASVLRAIKRMTMQGCLGPLRWAAFRDEGCFNDDHLEALTIHFLTRNPNCRLDIVSYNVRDTDAERYRMLEEHEYLFRFRDRLNPTVYSDKKFMAHLQKKYIGLSGLVAVPVTMKMIQKLWMEGVEDHILLWFCENVAPEDKHVLSFDDMSELFDDVRLSRDSVLPVLTAVLRHGKRSVEFVEAVLDHTDLELDTDRVDAREDPLLTEWCIDKGLAWPEDFSGYGESEDEQEEDEEDSDANETDADDSSDDEL